MANRNDFRKGLLKGQVLPVLVFIILVTVLFVTSNFTGKRPIVESITPRMGRPGEELVIRGKFFGKERNGGKVIVSGISPSTDRYLDWDDTMIRLRVPEEMISGLLEIRTQTGKSRQIIPFVNKDDIPVPLTGPLTPGEAYIRSIYPHKGSPGSPVTIKGMNFGPERSSSQVVFSWASSDISGTIQEGYASAFLPATENDHDYVSWNDSQIKVRVPDGASSGNVFVNTETGISNAIYFEVEEPVGQKRMSDANTYQIYYWVELEVLDSSPDNSLTIWIPEIMESSAQREVTLISREPFDPEDLTDGIMRFSFQDLKPGDTKQIKLRYLLKRYDISTSIDAKR